MTAFLTLLRSTQRLLVAFALAGVGQATAHAEGSPEILYLVTCERGGSPVNMKIAWYADWTRSQHGEIPNAIADAVETGASGSGRFIDYEATFSDGNRVKLGVFDASPGIQVGGASNDFREFVCYSDNFRVLFQNGNLVCKSQAYCTTK